MLRARENCSFVPKITAIEESSKGDRKRIFVDGAFCVQMRNRTFSAMNLSVGQEISCATLRDMETHFWKHSYGKASWEKEKKRLDRVRDLLNWADNRAEVVITGFGADSTEFIEGHPKETGKPDIEVKLKGQNISVLMIEVTGTEQRRGSDYWVRPDKLAYAQAHLDMDVWLVLHYALPSEKFVIIKPNATAAYVAQDFTIRGAVEHYVVFSDTATEIVSLNNFKEYLNRKLDEAEASPSRRQ